MSDAPIRLAPSLPLSEETRQQAMRYLSEALTRCEAREFEAAVIIMFRPDGTWRYDATGMPSTTRIIGAIEMVKNELIVAANREAKDG